MVLLLFACYLIPFILSLLSGLLRSMLTQNRSTLIHALKIFAGNFIINKDQTPSRAMIGFISRHTWQLLQTLAGNLWNQLQNFLWNVKDVNYFYGTTVCRGAAKGGTGVCLGSFISLMLFEEYPHEQLEIRIGEGAYTTMHEYGHYLQSKAGGPLYFFKYGLPSALGRAWWTEVDANNRAAQYFQNIDRLFKWQQVNGDKYRLLSDNIINPRWYEYLLFISLAGIPVIVVVNWKKPV